MKAPPGVLVLAFAAGITHEEVVPVFHPPPTNQIIGINNYGGRKPAHAGNGISRQRQEAG